MTFIFNICIFSRAKSNVSEANGHNKNGATSQLKNVPQKTSTRVSHSKGNLSSSKKDIRKEIKPVEDDIDVDDSLDIDMGILKEDRIETSHRKPAVRISPNPTVMV